MADKRNYYAIIPANVRYDKSLPANAKLLYGEITALCSDKGYCWATNKYFSDLFGVSQTSVSKWISMLVSKKYLFVKMVYRKGTKEILERHLSMIKESLEEERATLPIEEKFNTPLEEKLNTPIEEKFNPPIEEKLKENNTGTSTTVTNKSVNQSKDKETKAEKKIDRLTDEIRNKLKKQIDYSYFEDNFPEDLTGVDVLIDCMAEMLISPYTKINGCTQFQPVLKPYIDKADSESVKGFLEHMRGKKMRDVKNIRAYWQSAFINYLREEELTKLTI